jgi:tRNA/tmRNA/rRNA uracil-C5-methylase (TrmA/RlmC/RlmD family)
MFERQRNMKTAQVQEMFERLGGLLPHGFPPPVLDMIGTDEVFGYRFKITPHYNAPVPNKAPKRARGRFDAATTSSTACKIGPIGFKEKASCRLVDVPYYHIATPAINDALRCVRKEKQEEARRGVAEEAQQGQDTPAEGL